MKHLHIALWGVLPYLTLVLLAGGTTWRYHYDRFGFTTRSSQLYESRLLRIGGPLFHYGLLFVVAGHVAGLLVPEWLTDRLHVSEHLYHENALLVGGAAGVATATGLAVLLYRRLRVPAVRAATSRSDRVVHPLLTAVLLAGLAATASGMAAHAYDYRRGVSIWFRSLFALDPDVSAMAHAPLVYQVHALLAVTLFTLWPFSRLVHAFTAPVGYLVRPYVVYRSRTPAAPYRHPAGTARAVITATRGRTWKSPRCAIFSPVGRPGRGGSAFFGFRAASGRATGYLRFVWQQGAGHPSPDARTGQAAPATGRRQRAVV